MILELKALAFGCPLFNNPSYSASQSFKYQVLVSFYERMMPKEQPVFNRDHFGSLIYKLSHLFKMSK